MEEALDQINNITNKVQELEGVNDETRTKITESITSITTSIEKLREIKKNKNQLLVQLNQVNSKIEQFPG